MSIRARLLLSTAVIALVALVGAEIATYAALSSFIYRQVDTTLETAHKPVEQSISAGRTPDTTSDEGPGVEQPPTHCTRLDGRTVNTVGLTPGTAIEVRGRGGRTVWHCLIAELGARAGPLPVLPSRITGFTRAAGEGHELATYFTAETGHERVTYRVRASVLRSGPLAGGELIVAVPLTPSSGILGRLLVLEVVVAAAALVIVVVLGWWLVRASLHPLRDVERTAEAIAGGQLTERVPGDQARTEVGRVARAFNVMLERIEGAFAARDRTEADLRESEERMRRFVADASHELRTPLAAVRAYAELFDRGAATRPDDLRRAIDGIQAESGRMSHLVEDLLLLAHLDEGRPLHLEPVDLTSLAADAVTTARALGPQWPVALDLGDTVEVEADALRLRQVVDNLLGNVRVHCPPGTTATVTVRDVGDRAELEVADDGPGLSDEDAAHIFERFFRGDVSRSRAKGGAGLGLSIVAAIVSAHGGSVRVGRSESGGASFTVTLPKTYASSGEGAAAAPDPPR